eukprot:CAMPEP_0185848730 /NCGR_PEP_ID=MMETSP1354-20130828/3496_1 /TAXON_ID=708628 /ORGANISM="Erythrolobus madagascarensis, Strain CCMP3276" /LENGTH=562 /DNA_ID=CAMNT_0028549163 /DNA_START=12 /DNA_END=1703 /DNA_ORIENTATION=-
MTDNDASRLAKRPRVSTEEVIAGTRTVHADVKVESDKVRYSSSYIDALYSYQHTRVKEVGATGKDGDGEVKVVMAQPSTQLFHFRTERHARKLGLMQVGWGGNNGSTVTAAILASRHGISWSTRQGKVQPNYNGSIVHSSTLRVGFDSDGSDVFVPVRSMVPMAHADELVLSGWDIAGENLHDAMVRAQVLDPDLIERLKEVASDLTPLAAAFDPNFIAKNQLPRANNVIHGSKQQQLEQLRKDIRDFKLKHDLGYVAVVWTGNSERYSDTTGGQLDTDQGLLDAIAANHAEVSPSTLYAVAAVLEGCAYINGSPQNTFVPGCVELAQKHGAMICGDDFKSGQTKMKSVLADYLVSCGVKIKTMVTYNHLGNNDMYQLTDEVMWKPKSASKSRVIEDIAQSNGLLYKRDELPDHVVVVKYVPFLGDSKRDVSEYTSEAFLNSHYTTIMHNSALDSILCAPLIVDLAILAELFDRVRLRQLPPDEPSSSQFGKHDDAQEFHKMHSVMSVLGFFMKIPLTPPGEPIINALNRQRGCIDNMLRALVGLPPENHLLLASKIGAVHQ